MGKVYVFKSRTSDPNLLEGFTQPDISFENPNKQPYDQFGYSILLVKNTILIGAPGYSVQGKQRVGRVFAFDVYTKQLKWTISGSREFQHYGRYSKSLTAIEILWNMASLNINQIYLIFI